jgi:N-acetyl-alpha-D-glucosaminyl L-malate synthase BshA
VRIGISCYPTYGGSGVVATELAIALARLGDEVHIISYARPSRLVEPEPNLLFHQVTVGQYPLFEYPPYSLALATKMVAVARAHRLDLMHVHYAVPNAVSAILARQILAPQPLPVVTTLHGTDVTLVGNDPSYLETTRFGVVESDAVTTVSRALQRMTVEQLGISRPIEVIPNFIDPERLSRFAASEGVRRWAEPGERVLVHVSNFRPLKRVGDTIAIFAQVRERTPARLLMVGEGPERKPAEERCRELGIADSVTFLGNTPLIEEVLVNADLLLLPSELESFGLVALEALACGVPVIATQVGGLPEVVEDGVCGALRAVGDVEGMASAALLLLADPTLHRRYAQAGRQIAIERFGQSRIVERYRNLYEHVLTASRPRPGVASQVATATT